MTFTHLKVGDPFIRLLAGSIPMEMIVTKIENESLFARAKNLSYESSSCNDEADWQFDRKTGVEIDEDLHWGPKYGVTGSFIKEVKNGT